MIGISAFVAILALVGDRKAPNPWDSGYLVHVTARTGTSMEFRSRYLNFEDRLRELHVLTLVARTDGPRDLGSYERWTFAVDADWNFNANSIYGLFGSTIAIRRFEIEIAGQVFQDRALRLVHPASQMDFKLANPPPMRGVAPPDIAGQVAEGLAAGKAWFRVIGEFDPANRVVALTSAEGMRVPRPPDPGKELQTELDEEQCSVVKIQGRQLSGYGVCYAPGGWIVTTANLVGGVRKPVSVTCMDGRKLDTLIAYHSEKRDVAVLLVRKPPESLVPVALSEAIPQKDDPLTAMFAKVPDVVVTNPFKETAGGICMEFSISRGSSGCPLMDAEGRLAGLVSLRFAANGSLAVPVSTVRAAVEAGAAR